MTLKLSWYKTWLLRAWVCCGHLWELLLSPRFPERNDFNPVCPNCGDSIQCQPKPKP